MMINEFEATNGYVKSEVHNSVATIEFFHPKSNSLPSALLSNLAHEIIYAGNNQQVNVIVLRSAGEKAFCAGASFDELLTIENEKQGIQFFSGFAYVINAIRKAPKLVVARIHGKCVGGGVGIAAAADYTFATEKAEVKLSELAIGIGPFVVGPAIERKIGLAAFSQLAIDANGWRSADWAKRKGLYAELYESTTLMDEEMQRFLSNLSHYSPAAMHEMKKVLWHDTEHWDEWLHERAALSGKLILSDYCKNYIRQFKQKSE
jgi:methylglutaconyl-CoA hydratase